MISAPPNFITANAALSKQAIVLINIAGYWRVFTNFDSGLAARGGGGATGVGAGLGSGTTGAAVSSGIVNVPATAGPWNSADPSYPYHLTGTQGPPVQIPVAPGQYVRLTYRSGVVTDPDASYSPYGIGYGSTAGGIYPWPSDRCSNGGYPGGSNRSLLVAFTNASGNVIVSPTQLAYLLESFVVGPAPAGTTHLNLGVNSYEDWSVLSGVGWQIEYLISNSGVAGDKSGSGVQSLGGANCDWIEGYGDLALTVNELDGSAQIGGFSFTVVDRRNGLTADFPWFVFEGKPVTVSTGFPGMAQSDFALLFTGVVDTVQSANDNQSYTLNCIENLQALAQTIYTTGDDGQPTTKDHIRTLNGHPLDILLAALLDELAIPPSMVNQAKILGYRDGVFIGQQFEFELDSPPQASQFLEAQIMKPLGGYLWTNNKGQIDVNFFYKDTRPAAFFGCLIAAWADATGQLVSNPFAPGLDATLTAPAGATRLQLGVNDNSWGADGSGTWIIDVNGTDYTIGSNNSPWGFAGGINAAYPFTATGAAGPVVVPVVAGTSYHIRYLSGLLATAVTLLGHGNFRDATGVEPQITPSPAPNSPGIWVVQPWVLPYSQLSLTDDLMANVPLAGQVALINQISYRFDQAVGSSGAFSTESISTYDVSVARYNQYGLQIIESAGMRSGLQGVYLAAQVATLLFNRYGLKNLTIAEIDLFWSCCIVEPGDIVDVTSIHVPDRINGVMGVSGMLMEVFDRTWDFNNGIVKLRLIDASYIKALGTALFAPAGTPDWTLASSAQKAKYMFLCNDSDKYSDGSAGVLLP